MRSLIRLLAFILAACGESGPPASAGAHVSSSFDTAATVAVTRASTSGREFVIAPLRPMSADVEVLFGHPETPGAPFVMRIRELPGTRVPPHAHPVDEHITVVQGTWYFALGQVWDSASLNKLDVGTYAFAQKGSTMFAYSPDGAIVQIHGVGPFDIQWRDGVATLGDSTQHHRFQYRIGDRVKIPQGTGEIQRGYASGNLIQYEVLLDDGELRMVLESELQLAR